ncbi:MAG: TIM barrel protein [Planctomycetota bacterium]
MADTVIAAQLYTVRAFTKTPAEFARAIEKIRKIGYRAVQPSGHGPIDPGELKKILDDNGLVCCATHESYARFTGELDRLIEDHRRWGCAYPGIGSLPKVLRTAAGYLEFARQFDKIGERLTAAGMTFLYHNHDQEFMRLEGKLPMDIIMENSNPRHIAMEIDTHWVQRGGGDPAAWIAKCGRRGPAPVIHLKDYAVNPADGAPAFAEVGAGNLNWPAILAAAKAAGVEWYIVEQDTCPGDPFDSLKISYDNLLRFGLT